MTTQELDRPHSPGADPELQTAAIDKPLEETPSSTGMDSVKAAMNDYALKGWILLNDGCPDCYTPLMRNQEATNQICVNCEINPPVDLEEEEEELRRQLQEQQQERQDHELELATPTTPQAPTRPSLQLEDHRLSSVPLMNLPAPTAALPALPAPGSARPISPVNHRVSVLDPLMDGVRKSHRTPSGRSINGPASSLGTEFMQPPPPPRSVTPLPRPPKTPPPFSKAGHPLSQKPSIPPPPGPPPAVVPSLMSPPASPPAPKLMPRDKRRSPQSSVVVPGTILLPSTPPPNTLPLPRASLPTSPPATPDVANPMDVSVSPNVADVTIAQKAMQESAGAEGKGLNAGTTRTHTRVEQPPESLGHIPTIEEEDERGLESHDEFMDAEEEMAARTTEDEAKAQETNREQSARASRLMGQKMLQGWTMLQETCPNLACNGVPLMRSREKKELCVLCGTFYVREQDVEQVKYSTVPSSPVCSTVPVTPNTTATSPNAATTNAAPSSLKTTSPPPAPPPIIMPPHPRTSSPANGPSLHQQRATSPLSSPGPTRASRDLHGRISGPIVLPSATPMSPSFGMSSQQILSGRQSEDMDRVAAEDEEMRRAMQLIGKVHEFSARSLPPVPPVMGPPSASISRPNSTYSNSSDKERSSRPHQQHPLPLPPFHSNVEGGAPAPTTAQAQAQAQAPPRPPVSPEVQAMVDATHKTMTTLISKLEVYRLALEVSESAKESQALASQIRGLMECLKACREVL
ncbi:hypothetical protein BGZ99_007382 [Dissophora globulifera]|uniref:Uncharacterized protein n=1 Tax=Dissophora globulifera TaxID=979702 RepID=A0A9P6RRS5_9FUNG|nr:hypothetical protein BGZ99_007382 [Dissophora globulifera]